MIAARTPRFASRPFSFLSAMLRGRSKRLRRQHVESISLAAAEILEDRTLLSTITVTTDQDVVSDGDGDISLREAILIANDSSGVTTFDWINSTDAADTIIFDDAVFNAGSADTILLAMGQFDTITEELTIDGSIDAGTGRVIIDADATTANDSRHFDNNNSNTLSLDNLVLQNGSVSGSSAGSIRNFRNATLNMSNSTISGNTADQGGGILNSGTVNIENSTISGNTAIRFGGGIIIEDGTVNISNSTLSGNVAHEDGGAIKSGGTVNITNSTISGNSAGRDGGGILQGGTLNLNNVTIADNSAGSDGGGIINFGFVNFQNTIIATNMAGGSGPDISTGSTSYSSNDFNLIGDISGATITGTTTNNITGVDPMLGVLADNGGPTETHALLTGSPAIDAGNNALAVDPAGDPLTTDQRGETRISNGTVDIGSVELVVLVFDPDAFEDNDTIATATILGSEPTVILRDLTIDNTRVSDFNPPAFEFDPNPDVDVFKITAHDTGFMIFTTLFDHEVGNLDMRLRDMAGNDITPMDQGNSTTNNEQIVIPVVSQEMYFIEVFGVGGDTNEYVLVIENIPAPAPSGVFLDPASDTGMMNNDNITADNTPRFIAQLDLDDFADMGIPMDPLIPNPGVIVIVQLENISTGTVTTLGTNALGTSNYLWDITSPFTIPDNTYVVSTYALVIDPSGVMDEGPRAGNFLLTIDTRLPPL